MSTKPTNPTPSPTFTWDEEAQAGYLLIRRGEPEHSEEAFVEGAVSGVKLVVDLDKDGEILGVEILKL